MTSLTTLRAELDTHAGDVVDGGSAPRTVAVHERVRVIRRRRRTLAAGSLAAVLALTGGGIALTRTQDRSASVADRTLAGHVAPEHLESLGFGYTFAEGDQGSGTASLDLPVSDQPRLVSWAGSEDDAVTVSTGADTRSDRSDFGDFLPVYPGMSGRVSVTGEGRVAIAVYTLSELADGVSADGAVFRNEMAGDTLLDAAFSGGSDPISLTVPMPEGGLRVARACTGAPSGTWLRIMVNGEARSWGECGDWAVDAGTGGGTFWTDDGLPGPGSSVTVTATLTQGMRGPAVTPDGVVYGVGVYATGPVAGTAGGSEVPELTEANGHLWRYVSLNSGGPARSLDATIDGPGERYVVVYISHASEKGLVRTFVDGEPAGPLMGAAQLGASMGLGVVSPGSVVEVRADRAAGPRTRLGLAVYERID